MVDLTLTTFDWVPEMPREGKSEAVHRDRDHRLVRRNWQLGQDFEPQPRQPAEPGHGQGESVGAGQHAGDR